ncbi:MAG: hypothetical protein LBJ15_18160 [Comamonas sp.]|jgi:hypothetical protein|uniref:hypothetical protein n=1 Tax=Comamonas sp. TaxID=34028 RepID=UPI0028326B15|nr:hypothetical protein [Comamonas sp.]MDR0215901.1 hypothetical protein [Comamonas sp.]
MSSRPLNFANNLSSTLAVAIDGNWEADLVLTDDGSADHFPTPQGDGQDMFVTITNPSLPDAWEVVRITARDGTALTVERHTDRDGVGDYWGGWPAGSKIEARVTAGVLKGFLQHTPSHGNGAGSPTIRAPGQSAVLAIDPGSTFYKEPFCTGNGSYVFNSQTNLDQSLALGAYSVLPILHSSPPDGIASWVPSLNMAYESMGGTAFVDLGVPEVWRPFTNYRDGSVVVPTAPNGKQYWCLANDAAARMTSGELEPVWGETTPDGSGFSPGHWFEMAMPVDFEVEFDHLLMVTEVGFICNRRDAATPPIVSIGTPNEPTKYVDQSSLASNEGPYVHRFPVGAGGDLVQSIRFRLDSASEGGSFLGRFFYRGFFIDAWRQE